MYLYRVRNLFFLIIILGPGLAGCATTAPDPYPKRDMNSTYERRAAMEEQRQMQFHNSALYQGPVVVLPLIWYRW